MPKKKILKKYETSQKRKKDLREGSGVACAEEKCNGEMMIVVPHARHPEIKELYRAVCGKCEWRGFVPKDHA